MYPTTKPELSLSCPKTDRIRRHKSSYQSQKLVILGPIGNNVASVFVVIQVVAHMLLDFIVTFMAVLSTQTKT